MKERVGCSSTRVHGFMRTAKGILNVRNIDKTVNRG